MSNSDAHPVCGGCDRIIRAEGTWLMSNLPSRLGDAVDALVGRDASVSRQAVPGRVQRTVEHGVALEHGRAIVLAARARAVEYVANEAMQAVGGLTELEALYIQRAPLGEARYKAIVDTATCALANIVAETGRSR